MGKGKIDERKLIKLLEAGKTQREAAAVFGVTESAVSRRVKSLSLNIAKNVALERADQICEEKLDAMEELRKVHKAVAGELDWLQQEVQELNSNGLLTPALRFEFQNQMLTHVSEIRQQLKLALDIARTLYDAEAVRDFQREVIETIGEASPETRERIVKALQARRAIRSVASLEGRTR